MVPSLVGFDIVEVMRPIQFQGFVSGDFGMTFLGCLDMNSISLLKV